MTIREFYKAVAASAASDELKDFATTALAKMDEKNEKRRNTPTKAQKENEPLKAEILAVLTEGAHTAAELGAICSLSTQKVSALCRALVAEGKVTVTDIKVKSKGKVKQYTAIAGSIADGE